MPRRLPALALRCHLPRGISHWPLGGLHYFRLTARYSVREKLARWGIGNPVVCTQMCTSRPPRAFATDAQLITEPCVQKKKGPLKSRVMHEDSSTSDCPSPSPSSRYCSSPGLSVASSSTAAVTKDRRAPAAHKPVVSRSPRARKRSQHVV